MKSRQHETSLYMVGKKQMSSFVASVAQNLQLAPHSVISDYIYDPMTHITPSKKLNLLAMEAKRQSLCIDVIFQG